MLLKQDTPLLIKGQLVDAQGCASYGYVLVENGLITSVSSTEPPHPADAVVFDAGTDSYVFPGLINLHTHIDYNLLPIWSNPYMYEWDNRFEWRNNDGYHKDISNPINYVRQHWHVMLRGVEGPSVGVAFQALSEIQAVAGGTAILQENTDLNTGGSDVKRKHVLIRNTGDASDLGLPDGDEIDSQVDFYKPYPTPAGTPGQDSSSWTPQETKAFQDYLNNYSTGKIRGTLVHLAEGRSGVGPFCKGVDTYSRNEFDAFMRQVNVLDPDKVVDTYFGIIHGCGINERDDTTIKFLREYGMHLIWSPVSNMLLYGDTTFAPALWIEGVPTSLGSDWSPSGSKHVLEEAKYARFFFQALDLPISDLTLYQMITTIPASQLNLPAGRIDAGCFGDFFILRCPSPGLSPMETLFMSDDSDTNAVIVGGVPAYGDSDIFKVWGIEPQRLPPEMGDVASTKAVNFPPGLGLDVQLDFDEMASLLKSQGVSRLSLPLVVDDPYYQASIENLKRYTLWYAHHIRILPPSAQGPTRARFRSRVKEVVIRNKPARLRTH